MGARERLPMGQGYVRGSGAGRAPRDAAVGARANGCLWDEETCEYAAEGGHLEVLQWARANGCPWDKRTLISARKGCHVELLNWAIANGCPE